MAKQKGVNHADKMLRVHKVFEMLIEGKASTTVSEFCMKEWGVTQRTSYNYMTEADKLLGKTLQGKKSAKINRAVAQRETLIEKLIENGNFGAAIQGLADRDKLQGLYEVDKTEVNVNIEVQQS